MEKRRDDWTLFVRGIHGETLTLSNMKASSRGRELYSMLSAITGIPNTMMRLMRGKTILKPHVSLLESGLENGCTIDLYTPGCGGGKGIIIILLFGIRPWCIYDYILIHYRTLLLFQLWCC